MCMLNAWVLLQRSNEHRGFVMQGSTSQTSTLVVSWELGGWGGGGGLVYDKKFLNPFVLNSIKRRIK